MRQIRSGNSLEVRRSTGESQLPATMATYTVAEPAQESVRIDELATPLWRGKGTIALGAAIGIAIAGLVTLLMPPVYRAHTSMQLDGFNDRLVKDSPISQTLPNASPENYLQNEVKLLESEKLARRVAGQLGTPPEPSPHGTVETIAANIRASIRPEPVRDPRGIKHVQDAITVRTSLQSQVIDLYYDAHDPEFAAKGANQVAAEFVALNREVRAQLAADTTEWLAKQAAEVKASLAKANGELEAFARTSGLVFAGKQGTLAEDQMRQVQDALAKAEAELASKQARFEAAAAHPDSVMGDAEANGPLKQYQTDLQNLKKELAQLETIYTPTNYKVQKVQAQIAETEKAIENEHRQVVQRLNSEYSAAAGLERLLRVAHTRQLHTVEGQMDKERRYELKKSEIEAMQRLYETLETRTKEAGAASALRATNVRVIDEASAPVTPYSPKPPLNLAIGFALGSLAGAGLVLVRAGSTRVRQPGESAIVDLPELGVIPSARDIRTLSPARRRLLEIQPRNRAFGVVAQDRDRAFLAESFRATLTSILFSPGFSQKLGQDQEGRIFVVTSMDMTEGKTTVLTNLGTAAAERKQRVLLIDADIRRPRVHELMESPNETGLSELLRKTDLAEFVEGAPLESLVQETPIPNLWIMPAGAADAATQGQILAADLSPLFARLRREFDLILIDSPPMMLFSDSRVLGKASDGVIIVVRANTKSAEELKSAYVKLSQDEVPILGTILNDWKMDPRQTRVYNRYYRHYGPRTA